jgi:8-oxo-dGTP pyrophosphatase MutT (NUDIX family)
MKIRQCSAALAYTKNGNILLVTNVKGTRWGFPKGGLEAGLTPMENAAKECLEETGYKCSDKGFSLGHYEIFKDDTINRVEVFALALVDNGYEVAAEEEARRIDVIKPEKALMLLDRYLAPFVVRFQNHLEACEDHERRKGRK